MENMLFNAAPLVVNPELACAIGLNEAIVFQQIKYWVDINEKASRNFKDGYYWTYNTATEWQKQFPWWSEKTIRRTLTALENSGLVVSGTYNKAGFDRTKWYRIDYDALEKFQKPEQPNRTECPAPCGQNDQMEVDKLSTPIPETTQRLTENNSYNGFSVEKTQPQIYDKGIMSFISWYRIDLYQKAYGKEHPRLKKEQLTAVHDCLRDFLIDNPIDIDCLKEMAMGFFERVKSNDHNINHFVQRGILEMRLFDEGLC